MNSGALIKVKAWELVGGYDEVLFVDWTDHEFCLRITGKGYKIKQVTSEVTSHAVGKITRHRFFGRMATVWNHCAGRKYYLIRNLVYIELKYGKNAGIAHPLKSIISTLAKIWIWEDDKWNKTVAVFRGIKDGIKLGRER
jgi:rhamnosyltransferase